MDFTIEYDEDLKVIILNAKCHITLAVSKEMVDAEIEMLQRHPEASIIYNQLDCTADEMSGDDIFAISEYSAKLGELLAGKKLAVVLKDDLSFGLGRMWKSFTEVSAPFEIQLFRSFDKALEWVATQA